MRVLVVTVVHRPDDARIRHREITALLAAGHEVTYAAPWTGWGLSVPTDAAGLRHVDIPRSHGRRRLRAWRAAAGLIDREAPAHDVVLLHDPELVIGRARGRRPDSRPVVVWDVHEDTAAALSMKAWLPPWARTPVAQAVTRLETRAQQGVRLLLAEEGYAARFDQRHPVVPNSTVVPLTVAPPDQPRVVYVGHLSRARGAEDLVAMARELVGSGVSVEVVGHADGESRGVLAAAAADGLLTWHGYLPNDEALSLLEGSFAGLSLLHDEPNYRHSRPTKVIEYMARGVPVIATPTPPARALVEGADCGVVVGFRDPAAAAGAVLELRDDPARRARLGAAGHAAALARHNWSVDGPEFVAVLTSWVHEAQPRAADSR